MKKILLFSLMMTCLFSFGKCNKKKKCSNKKASKTIAATKESSKDIWLQYNETKCDNPWHFNWFVKPTEEQILGAVKGNLEGREITILEMRSTIEKNVISCEACTCPNGRQFYVRVQKADESKLKELKFFNTLQVPKENVIIDHTK